MKWSVSITTGNGEVQIQYYKDKKTKSTNKTGWKKEKKKKKKPKALKNYILFLANMPTPSQLRGLTPRREMERSKFYKDPVNVCLKDTH